MKYSCPSWVCAHLCIYMNVTTGFLTSIRMEQEAGESNENSHKNRSTIQKLNY